MKYSVEEYSYALNEIQGMLKEPRLASQAISVLNTFNGLDIFVESALQISSL